MEALIIAVQERLSCVKQLKYIDEDWGQLDAYSPHPPANFPCTLIDISNLTFTNIGKDNSSKPINRQTAQGFVTLTIANLRLSNTSQRAPKTQKEKAFSILNTIHEIHGLLHGWKPLDNCGALMRSTLRRIRRDDGIQEYQVVYAISFANT